MHKKIVWFAGLVMLPIVLGQPGCHQEGGEDKSPVVRLFELVIPDSSREVEQVKDELLSTDPDIRREAVRKLGSGSLAEKQATPKILQHMARKDPDGQVRSVAVEVLVKINRSEETLRILQEAARDSDGLVRRSCIPVLGEWQDEGNQELLLGILREDTDAELRAMAAAALRCYPDARTTRGLVQGLTDEEFSVNYQSRRSLVEITDRDFGYDHTAWQKGLQESPSAPSNQ